MNIKEAIVLDEEVDKFVGIEKLDTFYFHDLEKGVTSENSSIFKENYTIIFNKFLKLFNHDFNYSHHKK
ncbi:hypothetical protein [Flavobacterium geliluteum]|uniref:Uncharacterized protein n=1 Tax=Flavobacterium geliluteum TaxID=2816120 RepID=A0A940X627_9FLAO|nr:hypothetical protein [Flavobacterium geliluteum]MBP4138573.1 hypothetical protein [Flavobacterium geliluteum]